MLYALFCNEDLAVTTKLPATNRIGMHTALYELMLVLLASVFAMVALALPALIVKEELAATLKRRA